MNIDRYGDEEVDKHVNIWIYVVQYSVQRVWIRTWKYYKIWNIKAEYLSTILLVIGLQNLEDT